VAEDRSALSDLVTEPRLFPPPWSVDDPNMKLSQDRPRRQRTNNDGYFITAPIFITTSKKYGCRGQNDEPSGRQIVKYDMAVGGGQVARTVDLEMWLLP
jgi:hypothetical protein